MYKFIKNHVQNVESIIIYRKRQKSEHAMNPSVNCFAPFTIFGFLFELLFLLLLEIVFTGSLIKNQLVTNHTLDIALQNVFDSLCTSADSKVFLFGIRVLAQFVDRLIEWPQYCIRIVQISHLRSSHPELVAFVERALSRVSQAHASRSSVADGYANGIEAEATLHFHQMFSGQLTSHAMIQMLAHFKGSTDNREQAIFQCMIAKLCRECKLYAMYPERQLKIAAAFLGEIFRFNVSITYKSVINQALRAVLDELHEDTVFLFNLNVSFALLMASLHSDI
ncbi:hypothetical protein T459_21754 [Capsicum annuum]|uniref:CCR4-NOT transcription complex subunit 1 TTP binding domain-containing protein n=1 Tax=Capsicum annuum TaxID=4072 RepID=A0A2G2YXI7_CAPAN|nr:hypothetical protein T459_21754 [Capsicum annuum]